MEPQNFNLCIKKRTLNKVPSWTKYNNCIPDSPDNLIKHVQILVKKNDLKVILGIKKKKKMSITSDSLKNIL